MKPKSLFFIAIACLVLLSACSNKETLPNGMPLGLWRSRDGRFQLGLKGDQRVMLAGATGIYSVLDDGTLRITLGAGDPMDLQIDLGESGDRILVKTADWDLMNNVFLDLIVADNGPEKVHQRDLVGTWLYTDDYNGNCAFNKPPSECLDSSTRLIFEPDNSFRMEDVQDLYTQEILDFEGTYELFDGKLVLDLEEGEKVYNQVVHFGSVMVLGGSLVLVKVTP